METTLTCDISDVSQLEGALLANGKPSQSYVKCEYHNSKDPVEYNKLLTNDLTDRPTGCEHPSEHHEVHLEESEKKQVLPFKQLTDKMGKSVEQPRLGEGLIYQATNDECERANDDSANYEVSLVNQQTQQLVEEDEEPYCLIKYQHEQTTLPQECEGQNNQVNFHGHFDITLKKWRIS